MERQTINPRIERDPKCRGNISTSAGIRKGLPKEVASGLGFEDPLEFALEKVGEDAVVKGTAVADTAPFFFPAEDHC